MSDPRISPQARARDRAERFLAIRRTAPITDARRLHTIAAIDGNQPLQQPLPAAKFDLEQVGLDTEDILAAARYQLRCTYAHVNRSMLIIADLQDSLRSTMEIIRASRQLIAASDRLIARARTMDRD